MKTPDDPNAPADPADTQEVNVDDPDVSAVPSEAPPEGAPDLPPIPAPRVPSFHSDSIPPPAGYRPGSIPPPGYRPSQPPLGSRPSFAPPPRRSPLLYAALVLIIVLVAFGAGGGVFVYLRHGKPGTDSSAKPGSSVITIPTVEMRDEVDGGP